MNDKDEKWMTVADFPRYSVSNKGNMRGINGNKMRLSPDRYGYICVFLYKEGGHRKGKRARVHRLVAKAFIPNPSSKPYINHKDGVRSNNNVENLEWASNSDNQKHRFHVLGHGISEEHRKKMLSASIKACQKSVLCVETGELFNSVRDAAKSKGVCQSSISFVCSGRYKTAGGYHWRFI